MKALCTCESHRNADAWPSHRNGLQRLLRPVWRHPRGPLLPRRSLYGLPRARTSVGPLPTRHGGLVPLARHRARGPPPPPHCSNFKEVCKLEAAKKFEQAVRIYESRYPNCSDHGWSLTGYRVGSNDWVEFKTTPCGLPMAIKVTRHTAKECTVLKMLTTGRAYDECPGCFPRYYYRSNATRAAPATVSSSPRSRARCLHRGRTIYQQ